MITNSHSISESSVVIGVEHFIDDILEYRMDYQKFTERLHDIYQSFHSLFYAEYSYSVKINVFYETIHECGITEDVSHDYYERFVDIVFLRQQEIKKEHLDNIKQEQRNQDTLSNYCNDLIRHYSRLLVVRVDLGYKISSYEEVTMALFKHHIDILNRKITRKNGIFKHVHGYAWALEQGCERNYHCHLLLMFDGSKVNRDFHYAKKVGELWVNITNGMGSYFNCHDTHHKQNYIMRNMLGIGMVHRNNPSEVENFMRTACYLVDPQKQSQHIRVKTSKGMRTFGTGVFHNPKRRNGLSYTSILNPSY